MNIVVTGSFPRPLYRFYKEEKHAKDFIEKGQIRISSLDYYRSIEDKKRQDKTEGEGRWQELDMIPRVNLSTGQSTLVPGLLNCSTQNFSFKRIFCMSGSGVNLSIIAEELGSYIVKISDPQLFIEDFKQALIQTPEEGLAPFQIHCGAVIYNKGKILPEQRTENAEKGDISYLQKYPSFVDEYELRIAVIYGELSGNGQNDHHFLKLARASEYTYLVELGSFQSSFEDLERRPPTT